LLALLFLFGKIDCRVAIFFIPSFSGLTGTKRPKRTNTLRDVWVANRIGKNVFQIYKAGLLDL
jgi:hypothetical protein